MKILHLASFDRWTGAAAPAWAEVEALRAAGIEAHYGYIGGNNLERRVGGNDFAHAVLRKGHAPAAMIHSIRALRALLERERFEIVHAHLSHDHWLSGLAIRRKNVRLVRTFHARRAIRRDPLTTRLIAGTDGVCVVNADFLSHVALRGRDPLWTAPPLDTSQFSPAGADARAMHGLAAAAPIIGCIGKVVPGRGFEEAFQTFSAIARANARARLLVIGHGPHRRKLEQLASDLGIAGALVWAGYRDRDLADHYRAMDLMLFTAPGSDEGHRAVIEAMACGVSVVAYPIKGLSAVMGELAPALMISNGSPDALAQRALEVLPQRDRLAPKACAAASRFDYRQTAERLVGLYGSVLS